MVGRTGSGRDGSHRCVTSPDMVVVRRSEEWAREDGNAPGMERAIAVSDETVGSHGLYTALVTTPPGGTTRLHHHGDCETSIFVVAGRARFTWGQGGVEHEVTAATGDVVYVPPREVHAEANASEEEPLVVLVSRNCSRSVVVYAD